MNRKTYHLLCSVGVVLSWLLAFFLSGYSGYYVSRGSTSIVASMIISFIIGISFGCFGFFVSGWFIEKALGDSNEN